MKKLLYVTYFGFLSLIVVGCEQENVVPAAVANPDSAVAKIQPGVCTNYSYESKTGTIPFGTANTTEIFVAFDNNLTLTQKAAILSKYKPFRAINSEIYTESGLVTIAGLKVNVTCQEVDQLLQQLENEVSVRFALPTFTNGSIWDEFFVVLGTSGTERHLLQMVAATNTRIVGYPADYGPKTYVLSADKNSTGNVFDMLTYFNASARVAYAEPNGFIYPLPAMAGYKKVASLPH